MHTDTSPSTQTRWVYWLRSTVALLTLTEEHFGASVKDNQSPKCNYQLSRHLCVITYTSCKMPQSPSFTVLIKKIVWSYRLQQSISHHKVRKTAVCTRDVSRWTPFIHSVRRMYELDVVMDMDACRLCTAYRRTDGLMYNKRMEGRTYGWMSICPSAHTYEEWLCTASHYKVHILSSCLCSINWV